VYGTLATEETGMNKEDFLQGLQNTLSGEVPPAVVRENLNYYNDYIQTEIKKGRSEAEVMEELGDPRLIARTIMDITPGAGTSNYESYQSNNTGSTGQYQEDHRRQNDRQDTGNFHYYDLNKWYWKLLGIILVIVVFTVIITVVGGLLSLVIPMLPVIGMVILIMWFVRGPKR